MLRYDISHFEFYIRPETTELDATNDKINDIAERLVALAGDLEPTRTSSLGQLVWETASKLGDDLEHELSRLDSIRDGHHEQGDDLKDEQSRLGSIPDDYHKHGTAKWRVTRLTEKVQSTTARLKFLY